MGRLLVLGVGLLLVTLALQKDWVHIDWSRIQADLGIHRLIDPETNRIRLVP